MSRIAWDALGDRVYEQGVSHGVLYTDTDAVPWNGLVRVSLKPSGGVPTPYFIDGIKYLNHAVGEELVGTIEALTYPEEFEQFDGTVELAKGLSADLQPRPEFGFSYRTLVGDALSGLERGYKIHLIYNAMASPNEKTSETLTESSTPGAFQWDLATRPVMIPGAKPSAHLIIDTTRALEISILQLEEILYGSETTTPRLPTPAEIQTIFFEASDLTVVDNFDGSYIAVGTMVQVLANGVFSITHPRVETNSEAGTFVIMEE